MCTSTKNFAKIDTTIFNYKAIGFAYSISCGDGDYEAEVGYYDESDEERFDDYKSDLIDMAHNWTNCNHCGARMKYCVIVENIDTNTIHVVGRDCGDTIGNFGIIANRLADKTARAMKVAEGKIARKKFLARYEGLEMALESNNKIVRDIKEKFVRYNTISEKQVALVFKLAEKQIEIDATSKAIDFTKATNMALEVVSIKEQNSMYGMVTKILLKSSEGFKLYGNLTTSSDDVNVGDKVSLTSNDIKVSRDDKSFGFFSRAKITLVEKKEVKYNVVKKFTNDYRLGMGISSEVVEYGLTWDDAVALKDAYNLNHLDDTIECFYIQ